MKKDNKQRLFEVMGRLDKTFKPKLNEAEDYATMNNTRTMKSVQPTPQKSIFKQWFDGERHGEGSFMNGLLVLFIKADSGNKEKLQKAFPDVFSVNDLKYFTGESVVKENLHEWNFDKKKGENKEEKEETSKKKGEDKEENKKDDKEDKKETSGKKKWNFEKKDDEDKESEEHEETETPEEEKKEHKEKKELGEQEDNDGKKVPVTFWDKAKHGG
jgi:hypothetical protein